MSPIRCATFVALFLLGSMPSALRAQIRDPLIRTVAVSPTRVTVGGQFTLTATRVTYATGECAAQVGRTNITPRGLTVSDGRINAIVSLPTSIPASSVLVELFCQGRELEPVKLGEATLKVVPPIALTLTPASGWAGQSVAFSATGLIGSSFELWYAGARVFGPVPVYRTAAVSGKFVVPAPKSTTFPIATTVIARSLSGKPATGRGTASFSQVAKPAFRTRVLSTAPATVDRDAALLLTGTVEAADGAPQTRTVNVYWKGDDGRVVPIGARDVSVAADGSFTLGGDLPSEHTQDGYIAQGSGRFVYTTTEVDEVTGGVVTSSQESGPVQSNPPQNFSDSARARVRVVKPDGSPLAGALVEVAGGESLLRDPEAADSIAALMGPINQVGALTYGGSVHVPGCPLSLARGYTDEFGYFEFVVSRQAAADYASFQQGIGAICEFTDGRGGDDQERCTRNLAVNATMTIYTGHLGFGRVSNGVIAPYVIPAEFRLDELAVEDSRFWNPETDLPYNAPGIAWAPKVETQVVTPQVHANLYRRRAGAAGYEAGADAFEPYPFSIALDGSGPVSGLGRIFDFDTATPQGCSPGQICIRAENARFELNYLHDYVLAGDLVSAKLWVCANDRYDCGIGTGTAYDLDFAENLDYCNVAGYERRQIFLVPSQLEPVNGRIRGRLEVETNFKGQLLAGSRRFSLGMDALPDWFNGNQPELRNREILMGPDGRTAFRATESLTGGAPHEITASNGNLANYNLDPDQENSTDSSRVVNVYQQHRTEPPYSFASDITSRNEVANNPGDDTVVEAGHAGGSIPTREIIFVDTGSVPLFRYVWGVPPIASATVGADFWLQAGMNYGGSFGAEATLDAPPEVTFFTEPFMDLGIDVFFDLEILFGLVSAEITASPNFSLSMKSEFAAGGYVNPTAGVDECFVFRLDLTWEVCAILCEGDTENIFTEYAPESDYCRTRSTLPFDISGKGLADYRPKPTMSIAIDQSGYGAMFGTDEQDRFVAYEWDGGFTSTQTPKVLDTVGDSVTSSASAMYGIGTGVAVWSKVPGSPASLEAGTRNAHLMWAKVLAGGAQYQPLTLTSIGSGDGNVALAGCPDTTSACPDGGEVTAVWVRRIGATYAAHHYAVMYARYTHSGGWTTPARIDPQSGAASDTQPSVVYRGGTPVVAWVRKPTSGLANAETRQIAYRLLDGSSPVRIASELGGGVAWPSLSTRVVASGQFASLQVLLAYTSSTRTEAFVGNRNALHVARSSCGGAGGTCAWTDETIRDTHDREIMVERPTIIGQSNGDVAVGFRGLAFGRHELGNRFRAGDPPGMITGTGEAIMIRPKLDGSRVRITPITADASGGVRPAFGLDPSNGAYVSVSQPGPELPANVLGRTKALTPNPLAKAAHAKVGETFLVATVADGPDLAVSAVTTTVAMLEPGATAPIEVAVENFGDDYAPETEASYTLVATWDGPEGTATPALSQPLAALDTNASRVLALDVPVPAGFRTDDVHTLFVTLRPDGESAESNAIDNERMLSIGAMPIPSGLVVTYEPGEPMVFLNWSIGADDPRVAGYRVMLVDEEGNRKALGSSPVLGFVDLAATIGEPRSYVVTSYSANGVESAESAVVTAIPPPAAVVAGETGLLSDGFEDP